MIVLKFGGTSVENAAAIRRAAAITAGQRHRRPLVVVSAMAGVTNALLEAAGAARAGDGDATQERLDRLIRRHRDTAAELVEGVSFRELERRIDALRSEADEALRQMGGSNAPARWTDALLATGELLSAELMSAGLTASGHPSRCVDIRPLLKTNGEFGRAAVDIEASGPRLVGCFRAEPGDERIPVTQGFIGSSPDGTTTTIGRGGSDLTASILGAALSAEEVQIWTDVDGILTTDPHVVPGWDPLESTCRHASLSIL